MNYRQWGLQWFAPEKACGPVCEEQKLPLKCLWQSAPCAEGCWTPGVSPHQESPASPPGASPRSLFLHSRVFSCIFSFAKGCPGCLPFTSTRIKSCAAAAAGLQYPLKGVQDGEQEWACLCSGKTWQNRSSDRYFQKLIVWAQFLYCLISRKALKSFMVMTDPCDEQKSPAKKKKKCVLECMSSPFAKVMYILTFPCLFGKVSQRYLRCCPQANILIWPQIKLNLQLPRWEFFFFKLQGCHCPWSRTGCCWECVQAWWVWRESRPCKETETEQNCFSCH